jgi:hypothetical protein
VLGHKDVQGVVGQHELISKGGVFMLQANATNLLTAAVHLTQNWIGPSDSVMQQQQV